MAAASYTSLLNLLWRSELLTGREFTALAGDKVTVVAVGESVDPGEKGVWTGAEIVVDGERRRGPVAVGEDTRVPDGAVLRVVCGGAGLVLGSDDRLVPQVRYEIEPKVAECYDALRKGAAGCECAERIAAMQPVYRTELFTRLLVERLQRKYGDIMRIFGDCECDWNQTFYVMLLRVMGGNRNREAYMSLAGRVTQAMLSREKDSPERLEAMLLGGGGFLFAREEEGGREGARGEKIRGEGVMKDDYTLWLEDEFRHLAGKYSIMPLKPAEWETTGLHISNYPTLRLVEIAALLAKRDFVLDTMLGCRSLGDLEELFGVQASGYWDTHYKPGGEYGLGPKRIGRVKTALIGINLAVPVMFAYGRQTGDEAMCERALDLLASIPAEKNSKTGRWYDRGCRAENGFESQALLQLTDEYCAAGRCADCSTGRGEIKKHL